MTVLNKPATSNRRALLTLAAVALLLLIVGVAVRALLIGNAPALEVIAQSEYRLSQTYRDDLAVVSDTIQLTPGSQVNGDASLVGGNIVVEGQVDGNLVVISEQFTLAEAASVAGDLTASGVNSVIAGSVAGDLYLTGEKVSLQASADIAGDVMVCGATLTDRRANPPALVACNPAEGSAVLQQVRGLGEGVGGSLLSVIVETGLFAVATIAGVTLFPRRASVMGEMIRLRPRHTLGAGLAVSGFAIGIGATLFLISNWVRPLAFIAAPLFILFALALACSALAGLIALLLVVGDGLARRFGSTPAPLFAGLFGVLVVILPLALLTELPVVGIVAFVGFLALAVIGLGAAALTRWGGKPLQARAFVQG